MSPSGSIQKKNKLSLIIYLWNIRLILTMSNRPWWHYQALLKPNVTDFIVVFRYHSINHISVFAETVPGSVFWPLHAVSSDYAQPITGQVTEVTCPVIDRAQPEITPSKRQKTGHESSINKTHQTGNGAQILRWAVWLAIFIDTCIDIDMKLDYSIQNVFEIWKQIKWKINSGWL